MSSPSSPEGTASIAPAPLPSSVNLPSIPPRPSSSFTPSSSSTPPAQPQPHPFSALLTPYSSSPLYPPSPPSPPPPPLSTLRCLLLSSSLPPPPPPFHPLLPHTPYTPPPPVQTMQKENIPRSRALCWRRTELTREEWERERKGVDKWLSWCEGRELVLVSGGESVRKWVVDGGAEALGGSLKDFEGPARLKTAEDGERGVMSELRDKAGWPEIGKWVGGEENYTHLLPLHPPLHALLSANVKVLTTIESMYSRYVNSFFNGTQSNALKLVVERSPDAWKFINSAVRDAWKNAPKNWDVIKKFGASLGGDDGGKEGGR